MRHVAAKVLVAVLLAASGGGAVVFFRYRASNTPKPAALVAIPQSSEVHTADWYVAHADVLHQDGQRCAGDAATISPAACQNVASAESRLYVIEMRKAAAANAAPPRANSKPQ
jgi:hypothetical protein